jgi:ABC-type uncharacterized transport system ATPase subunit
VPDEGAPTQTGDGQVLHAPSADGRRVQGPAAELRSISTSFFGVAANDRIDFDVRWGEVHALLGENGAGKTTLCSILSGLYRPDEGDIRIHGERREFRSPHDALAAGIGMVYQHFRLVRPFTVAENILLGHPGIRLARREIEQEVSGLVERYGLWVQPSARIWQLSVGEQQRVEIMKLLYRGVRVLVLDEPTAVLTPRETRFLFRTVRAMAEEGKAIVFVSHKLDEILEISDRVTVLRDGRKVGELPTEEADVGSLARMMVGRDLLMPTREAQTTPGERVLAASALRVRSDRGHEAVQEVDLDVAAGEIVAIAGVAGNGQRELAEALAGLRPVLGGTVWLEGFDLTRAAPLERIRRGVAFVPEDRLGMGLAPGLALEENLALKTYRWPPNARGPFLSKRGMQRRGRELAERFDVRGVQGSLPVGSLSGGNLQRAILARELSGRPRLLIAASPTRGLDVGATGAIRRMLLEERARGLAILLISEDLDEVRQLSDRIFVMHRGRIVGEIRPEDFDLEQIGLLMGGGGSSR